MLNKPASWQKETTLTVNTLQKGITLQDFYEQQMDFNKQVIEFMTEQKKFNEQQRQFNGQVVQFMTEQKKFNEFVMKQFKTHGWVK